MSNTDNEKEINKLLKERAELLFSWHLELNYGEEEKAQDILNKKTLISEKIKELGGDFNISQELFNEIKQELLNKKLDRKHRALIEELPYNDFGKKVSFACGEYHN